MIKKYRLKYPLPSGMSLNHNNKLLHYEGEAEYDYATGTKFNVIVTDTSLSQKNYELKPYDSTTGIGTYDIYLDGKKLDLILMILKTS